MNAHHFPLGNLSKWGTKKATTTTTIFWYEWEWECFSWLYCGMFKSRSNWKLFIFHILKRLTLDVLLFKSEDKRWKITHAHFDNSDKAKQVVIFCFGCDFWEDFPCSQNIYCQKHTHTRSRKTKTKKLKKKKHTKVNLN